MSEKRIQFGNEGEELVPSKTDNLSSAHREEADATLSRGKQDFEAAGRGDQRGDTASFDPRTGAVHGSGSNAGGGGTAGEDYDADSTGGAAEPPVQAPRR